MATKVLIKDDGLISANSYKKIFADCPTHGPSIPSHAINIKWHSEGVTISEKGNGYCSICLAPSKLRFIKFTKKPTLTECNGKCLSAKGPACSCVCYGENHGLG